MKNSIQPPTTYAINWDSCGEEIQAGEDFLILDVGNETYQLCSRDCLDDFIDDRITPFEGETSTDYINANGEETTERNSGWEFYNDID